MEPIQLLEGAEYRYSVEGDHAPEAVTLEPAELFQPDDLSGLTGRLRPGLATGRVEFLLRSQDRDLGRTAVEVRARKLDYLTHYRWMLRDVADTLAEILMERFAASEQRFAPDDRADARTLYQRFEFLLSLLSAELEGALHQVVNRPYVSWEQVDEVRRPQEGLRLTSQTARELARPGPRIPWSGHPRIVSLPERLISSRTEVTLDNLPNRFVKFAITRWRDLCVQVEVALQSEEAVHPVERGLREVRSLLSVLDGLLGEQLFREAGPLTYFPAGNQVLQRRAGYRDVFRAYIQLELAAKVSWRGGEGVYGAGQRNVAALYEFWTFFELARVVSEICTVPLDLERLIDVDSTGLGLRLQQGSALALRGQVERLGRQLDLELWFNRTFGSGAIGSWSRPLRPDASLRITAPGDSVFTGIWIHFDAKYRVEAVQEILGDAPKSSEDEQRVVAEQERDDEFGSAKRADLLKMHAYRDAIRRSAGAYVIYPGQEPKQFHEYHEILPGLGAFGLRPSAQGEAEGRRMLKRFIENVVSHAASQVTQHERARYWVRESTADFLVPRKEVNRAPFLRRPPADTRVLLGYVRSPEQLEWIHRTGLYNLRAGERSGAVGLQSEELACELVVLYGAPQEVEIWQIEGEPILMSRGSMIARQYPRPRGDLYICLPTARLVGTGPQYGINSQRVIDLANKMRGDRPKGAPIAVTWDEVARSESEAGMGAEANRTS